MRIVILGCGFGGMEAAKKLRKLSKKVEIVIIDNKKYFEYQAALPEILSEKTTQLDITASIKKFANSINAIFLNDLILNIDLKSKKVEIKKFGKISYDFLIIAIGAQQTYFGIPGAEQYSNSINSLYKALKTKQKLDSLLLEKPKNVVILGAGLTGVETAGELAYYFKNERINITLVEATPQVMPAFSNKALSKYVDKILSNKWVNIRTNSSVTEVTSEKISFLKGDPIYYDVLIWTAGIIPNKLIRNLDIPKIRGWLKTDFHLKINADVFAIGDTISYERKIKRSGQNAEEAEKQGEFVAKNIIRQMLGKKLKIYKPKNTIQNPRAIITLGDNKAILFFKGKIIKLFAYKLKKFIEYHYMKRFR